MNNLVLIAAVSAILLAVLTCTEANSVKRQNPKKTQSDAQNNDDTITIGDILYKKETYLKKQELSQSTGYEDRNALAYLFQRWPNSEVPYEITPGDFSSSHIQTIEAAIKDWGDNTCLKFVKTTTASDRIRFRKGTGGCSSYIGKIGGVQPINLNYDTTWTCVTKGIVIHEIGHALGLFHEQSRPDRDDYVTILYENIVAGAERNFDKESTSVINTYGVPYDYTSIMHYGKTYFSKNGGLTIVTKDASFQDVIGQRSGLSNPDIEIMNLMYSCPQGPTCNADQFKCADESACISSSQRCDGQNDCPDSSDEANCPLSCTGDEFKCADDSACIPSSQRCDQNNDCGDGSDEAGCPLSCNADEFKCADESACIPSSQQCDQNNDCTDGSDEAGCPLVCGADEFKCTDESACVPTGQLCDGVNQCTDGSDELGCPAPNCASNQFECGDGSCVALSDRCNNNQDCGDGSDEQGCGCVEWGGVCRRLNKSCPRGHTAAPGHTGCGRNQKCCFPDSGNKQCRRRGRTCKRLADCNVNFLDPYVACDNAALVCC